METIQENNNNQEDLESNVDTKKLTLNRDSGFPESPNESLAELDVFVQDFLEGKITSDDLLKKETVPEQPIPKDDIEKLRSQVVEAKFNLAFVESDQEEILDRLLQTERERDLAYMEVIESQRQKDELQQRINILESGISLSLQERDSAFGEQYLLSQQIKGLDHQDHQQQDSTQMEWILSETENLERSLVQTKLELAEIKGDLDKQQLAYRVLEREFVAIKLDLAQATSSEDDFRISLEHALREKQSLQTQLVQMSEKLAVLHGMN